MGILSFLARKAGKIIVGAAVVGTAAAVHGAANTSKAKKINKEAEEIQQKALEKYDRHLKLAEGSLKVLGENEAKVINSFSTFCDNIERIQGRPEMNTNFGSVIDLPKYSLSEIKKLPESLSVALSGAAGAGAGALIGLAAFGATTLVVAPTALLGGIVICAKGSKLKKQAIQNIEQAKKLSSQVDEVCNFYARVSTCSKKFCDGFSILYRVYDYHLRSLQQIVSRKEYWYLYTDSEKKLVENTVLITGLLFKMCKTKVVDRVNEVEYVNESETAKLTMESTKLIGSLAY